MKTFRRLAATLAACTIIVLAPPSQAADQTILTPKSLGGIFDLLLGNQLNIPIVPKSTRYSFNDNVVVVAEDGTKLSANIFIPTGAGPFPAVIMPNAWATNEYLYLKQAARFAEQGYIVLSYSSRGWGTSGGAIDIFSDGSLTVRDGSKVIDWLIANAPVDAQRIGMAGVSMGAGNSLLVAAVDPRVKSVTALSGWGDMKEAMYGGSTPRFVWQSLLLLASTPLTNGSLSPELVQNYTDTQLGTANLPKWLEAYGRASPLTYVNGLNAHRTAVMISNNYGDGLFPIRTQSELFRKLQGPKRFEMHPGEHAFAELSGMLGSPNGVWDNALRWHDRFLKGIANGIDTEMPVQADIRFAGGRRDGFSQWPPAEAVAKTYTLHDRGLSNVGRMAEGPYKPVWPLSGQDTFWSGMPGLVGNTGIPILSPLLDLVIDAPVLSPINLLNPASGIGWHGPTVTGSALRLRGAPVAHLTINTTTSNPHLVAYLFDVDVWGTGKLITHGPLTKRNAARGQAVAMDIRMDDISYDVPVGHHVALVVDTSNILYTPPLGSPYQVKLNYDASTTHRLELPVLKP